jgi:hypothetical protein
MQKASQLKCLESAVINNNINKITSKRLYTSDILPIFQTTKYETNSRNLKSHSHFRAFYIAAAGKFRCCRNFILSSVIHEKAAFLVYKDNI